MLRALIVDDDRATVDSLSELVAAEGFAVATASSLAEAQAQVVRERPDVVLCDLVLPDGHGIDLLQHEAAADLDVLLITGHATVETAVEALRQGVFDYLTKPVDVSRLKALLASVRRTSSLRNKVVELRQELRQLGRFGPLVGRSPQMQQVYDLIDRVAPTEATVFVTGESGTGKELVAQTIHELSQRSEGPFLPLNCGAVSPNLIESELFGHERGSFTGASRSHQGHFERATGGTLFLDEITEMPIELQVKLLRVLETGSLTRVGAERQLDVDVRVVAASNRDPRLAIEEGTLREDLYYRLNVFPIQLPPLRLRDGDVEALVLHFMAELGESTGNGKERAGKSIAPAALECLNAYSWPGNVRELRNVVQRAMILADEEIALRDLPAELRGERVGSDPFQLEIGLPLEEVKRRLILGTIARSSSKKEAAGVLGISLKTLYNNLKRYESSAGDG